MRIRSLPALLVSGLVAVLLAVGVATAATPASAAPAVTTADKLSVATSWTQATTVSRNAWLAARSDQSAWAAYGFDWSTDYCSDSPDQPLGFDFRLPCARHDFGYRNFKALGAFTSANKSRIDSMFLFDMKAVCATHSGLAKATCNGIAETYYEAVHEFGSVSFARVG